MSTATVADLRVAERILVYGVTGSGKSTAAIQLARLLGHPVHLVDEQIGWLPGWTERGTEEQREIAARLVAQDRWILDSAYGKWADLVLPRAQVVLALDYPRWLSLTRLLRRTAYRWATGAEMCNGNRESARQIFSRDSIIVWHFRSYPRKTRRLREWESGPDDIAVLRVTHPRELSEVLTHLRDPG